MKITKVSIRLAATIPHVILPYANVRPEVEMWADCTNTDEMWGEEAKAELLAKTEALFDDVVHRCVERMHRNDR